VLESVIVETTYSSAAPRRCMTPRTFSAEKKRSATMPTRNGATMAPQGMVL